jgi:hypothetical protein
MWLISILRSPPGRVLKAALGAWLLIQGLLMATLAGLVMMMSGVVLVVTALANVCLLEEAVAVWTGYDRADRQHQT